MKSSLFLSIDECEVSASQDPPAFGKMPWPTLLSRVLLQANCRRAGYEDIVTIIPQYNRVLGRLDVSDWKRLADTAGLEMMFLILDNSTLILYYNSVIRKRWLK